MANFGNFGAKLVGERVFFAFCPFLGHFWGQKCSENGKKHGKMVIFQTRLPASPKWMNENHVDFRESRVGLEFWDLGHLAWVVNA